ncbi:hypothetical protein N9521_02160 [Gammaproteobacteria bacterium]|nr:hypothetical protein [Gammaproteobacteria bacterium]
MFALIGGVLYLGQDRSEYKNERDSKAIADYMSCVTGSKTIEINGLNKEMTEGNMIAICISKNELYRNTDHYKNNHQSYKDKVCANQKLFNRDVLKSEEHRTYKVTYSSGLTIPAIHDRNAFFTMYNMNQRAAYWKEKYRSSGESYICTTSKYGE